MRLWHKQLIDYLPRAQLVSQWRELVAIASNIKTKGTPNHILVNKIMDYSMDHFITYAEDVRFEMSERGYKTSGSSWDKIFSVTEHENYWYRICHDDLYAKWMNYEYLEICYYNLLEKFRCGGISKEEWELIEWSMQWK